MPCRLQRVGFGGKPARLEPEPLRAMGADPMGMRGSIWSSVFIVGASAPGGGVSGP